MIHFPNIIYTEKKVDQIASGLNESATVELAISAMMYILSTDFKGSEVEIGVVTSDKRFRMLNQVRDRHIEALIHINGLPLLF